MKHFARLQNLVLAASVATVALCGCGSSENAARDAAKRVADDSKVAIESHKNALGEGVITTKNSTLQGNDAQGRLLWRLNFKEGRLNGANGDTTSISAAPRTGDLIGANATLYRNGREESSFKAKKMTFTSTPRGLMLTMSGGVNVSTVTTNLNANATSSTRISSTRVRPVQIAAPVVRVDVQARKVRAEGGVRMTQDKTVVTAKQVAADTGLTIARAGGSVVGVAPGGKIRAQNAAWNWKTGRVQATGGVTVSSAQNGGAKLSGAILSADTNANRGEISGGVRAVSGDGGQARAGRVIFNWASNSVVARDGVTLQKDGATLRAARIDSDSNLGSARASGGVTLQKDGATVSASTLQAFDRATRIEASGDVRVTRDNSTLTAARADVWLNEKRAVASGNVTLTRADSTVRADRVQGWQDGRVVASGDVTLQRAGATLRANNMQGWQSGRAIATGDVRLTRDDVTMTAPRVESANIGGAKTNRVLASGGVTARGRGGEIRAQKVTWGNGQAVASGDVRLSRDGNTIRGAHLTTDQNFAQAVLSGDVNGTMKNGARFSSSNLTWTRLQNGKTLPRNGRIVAQNGVTLRQKTLTLRGARFEANGDGSEARVSGGVVATDSKGAQVRAQNAIYNAATGKIIARGDVFYRDASGNTLRGTDLEARVVGGSLQGATLNNVTGLSKAKLFEGKTLFGN